MSLISRGVLPAATPPGPSQERLKKLVIKIYIYLADNNSIWKFLFVKFITPVTHFKDISHIRNKTIDLRLFNQIRLSLEALRPTTIDRADSLQITVYSQVGLSFGQFAQSIEMRCRFSFTLF